MNRPPRIELPFFAYGLFRPDQLGFHQLRPFVTRQEPATAPGELRIRDGLPILKHPAHGTVDGYLLFFGKPELAYDQIIAMEPDSQYRWQEITISDQPANVLLGRSPDKGSDPAEESWDGATDPLFSSAIDVVKETRDSSSEFAWDLAPTFRLEMAYLLLWSSIERYLSLKFHLGGDVYKKIRHLADEPAFVATLQRLSPQTRSVYRADHPSQRLTLTTDPWEAVDYYYQIRSNISHRGKAMTKDHDRVRQSLDELITLFEAVLDAAFQSRQRQQS